MEEEHRNLLKRKHRSFVNDLIVDEDFLSYLISSEILSDSMQEDIMNKPTKRARASAFMTLIPRRGPEAFKQFIFALMETKQSHLALLLDEEIVEEWKKSSSSPEYPKESVQDWKDSCDQSSSKGFSEGTVNMDCAFMQPKPLPVDPSNLEKILLQMPEKVYAMGSKPRGRAIIVNIEYFDYLNERQGSSTDVVNLTDLFEALHFTVDVWGTSTAQELKERIYSERKRTDHKNYDIFIFVILSHGTKGIIYCRDGHRAIPPEPAKGYLDIETDILQQFDGLNCPNLVGKPKVFLIQACQGGETTEGVLQADGTDQSAELSRRLSEMQVQEETDSAGPPLHEKADMLVVYSTVPGYLSMRNTELGTWFVRDFVETFAKDVHQEDLSSLFTMVTNKISMRQGIKKQVQICKDERIGIRKKIFLLPGYFRD